MQHTFTITDKYEDELRVQAHDDGNLFIEIDHVSNPNGPSADAALDVEQVSSLHAFLGEWLEIQRIMSESESSEPNVIQFPTDRLAAQDDPRGERDR